MPPLSRLGSQSHPLQELDRRRWWIVGLLFFAGLINYFDRIVASVALPLIAADFRLGPARMGVLLSAFFWSYSLMQIPIGWLSDRVNLRWLYAACFALWSVTCGLSAFATSLGALLVLRIFLGIGESIYVPGSMKIVSVLFPSGKRGLASGLATCGSAAGLAVGAPLIGYIVVAFGWKHAFFLLGFVSLAWLVPWIACFPRGANTAEVSATAGLWGRVDLSLLGLGLSNIGYGYYFYLLVTWLPAYLVQTRHLPIETAAGYLVVPYLTFAAAEPMGGWIADRLIRSGWDEILARKTVVSAAYLSGILLIPAVVVRDTRWAVVLLGGAALLGLSTGNLYALVQRLSPAEETGFSLGFFNLAGNLSGVAAPLATGLIVAHTGSYLPAFLVAVVILLAVLPLHWRLIRLSAAA